MTLYKLKTATESMYEIAGLGKELWYCNPWDKNLNSLDKSVNPTEYGSLYTKPGAW